MDRDHIDDLFRSKLYDFEVETAPEDWEAIESGWIVRPFLSIGSIHISGWQQQLLPCWSFFLSVFRGVKMKMNW